MGSTLTSTSDILDRCIKYSTLPCWYELSYDVAKKALILRIHQDFATQIEQSVMPNTRLVDLFLQDFGFNTYQSRLNADFGFDSCCQYAGIDEDQFTNFIIPIPQIVTFSHELCADCYGTGKDKKRGYDNERCLSCRGTGEQRNDHNWQTARAISATLNFFLLRASLIDTNTSARRPQLATIQTVCAVGQHGGELGGDLSIPLMNWLKSVPRDQIFPSVIDTMKTAWYKMFRSTVENCEIQAYVHGGGRITIDCPGDRTGIFICQTERLQSEHGNKFTSHDVDTCAQQITLLVGLASLCDLARLENPACTRLDP